MILEVFSSLNDSIPYTFKILITEKDLVTLDHLFPTAPIFLKAEFVTMVLARCDS